MVCNGRCIGQAHLRLVFYCNQYLLSLSTLSSNNDKGFHLVNRMTERRAEEDDFVAIKRHAFRIETIRSRSKDGFAPSENFFSSKSFYECFFVSAS